MKKAREKPISTAEPFRSEKHNKEHCGPLQLWEEEKEHISNARNVSAADVTDGENEPENSTRHCLLPITPDHFKSWRSQSPLLGSSALRNGLNRDLPNKHGCLNERGF